MAVFTGEGMTDRVRLGKIFFVGYNVVYATLAIIMFSFGIYVASKFDELMDRLYSNYYYAAEHILLIDYDINGDEKLYISLVASSSVAYLLIFLNFMSMDTKNTKILRCLAYSLMLVGGAKIIIGTISLAATRYPYEIKSYMKINFDNLIECIECRGTQSFIEEEHDCCGIDDPTDYLTLNAASYPSTCYKIDLVNNTEVLKLDGCADKVKGHYFERLKEIGMIFLTVGLFEILGLIFIDNLVNDIVLSTETTV